MKLFWPEVSIYINTVSIVFCLFDKNKCGTFTVNLYFK